MIIHLFKIRVSPGNRLNAVRTLESVSGPANATAGCIFSSVFNHVNNDDLIMLLEKWDSRQSLQKHVGSKRYKRLLEVMELAVEEPIVEFHQVSGTDFKEFIERCVHEESSVNGN